MKKYKSYCCKQWIFLLSFIFLVAGCGGGSSSSTTPSTTTTGTGSSLKVAEKVSVVDAQSSSKPVTPLKIGKISFAPAAGSDYYNDPQTVWVEEGSAEAFDTINEILCSMAQSQYDDMVNKGDYKAQIDMSKCSSSSDSASSAGQSSQNQSSGSTASDYEMWTLNSSRADDNSPHYVKAWIHQDADKMGKALTIYALVTITESVSSTNPYGIFTLYFKSEATFNGTTVTPFKGFLKAEKDSTGKVLLKFANKGGFDMNQDGTNDFGFDESVTTDRAADGSSGSGTTKMSNTSPMGTESAQYDFAFTTANFIRRDASTSASKCFSRTTFDETVWRYGLYDATTGTRTEINSGFPIKTDSSYGWIGYYGLWFPQDVTINDGDTVYKVDYSQTGETKTTYTVVKKGGKLKKNTRHTTTLADIKGIPLDFGSFDMSTQTMTNYRVKWDSTQGKFLKFAKMNDSTHMWENLSSESELTEINSLQFGDINFYSQSLGGQVRVKRTCTWSQSGISCTAPSNTSGVIYFTEDIVYAGDTVPSSLTCYDNCPKYDATSGVTQADPDYNPVDGTTSYTYTFDSSASGMILKDSSGNSLVMTKSGTGTQQWGFMSGPIFDPTAVDSTTGKTYAQLLACDWDSTQTCGWKAWGELPVYYTWETGTNSWNQLTILKDSSGTALKFEPPIQVLYAHTQTDSTKGDYKYNGTKFYLEYSGFGNLWGIPGKCVDFDTGADTSCGPKTRWIPEFSIPDGSEMTKSDDSTKKYVSKALEKEQRMSNVADSNCSSLTLTSYTLPSTSDWVDPNIGTEPTVTNAPAVVGGVLQ